MASNSRFFSKKNITKLYLQRNLHQSWISSRNSYPFDWTRSSLEGILHCMETRFEAGCNTRSYHVRFDVPSNPYKFESNEKLYIAIFCCLFFWDHTWWQHYILDLIFDFIAVVHDSKRTWRFRAKVYFCVGTFNVCQFAHLCPPRAAVEIPLLCFCRARIFSPIQLTTWWISMWSLVAHVGVDHSGITIWKPRWPCRTWRGWRPIHSSSAIPYAANQNLANKSKLTKRK